MAILDFIVQLHEKVGHAPLWLLGVTAIVIRDVPPNAPMYALPEILLVRHSDNGEWTPVTGIIGPDEQPHDAAVREVKEEMGPDVIVEALLGTGAVGPIEHLNDDIASYLDISMRCSVVGDDVSYVADDGSTDVGWSQISQMPPMMSRFRLIAADAIAQLKHLTGFKPRMGYHKRERQLSLRATS